MSARNEKSKRLALVVTLISCWFGGFGLGAGGVGVHTVIRRDSHRPEVDTVLAKVC